MTTEGGDLAARSPLGLPTLRRGIAHRERAYEQRDAMGLRLRMPQSRGVLIVSQ